MNGVLRYYYLWNTEKGAYDICDRQTSSKIDEIRGYLDSSKAVDALNAADRKGAEPVIELPTTYSSTRHREKIEVEPAKIYKE